MGFRGENQADVGKNFITSTAVNGNWWRLYFLAATTFTSLSDATCSAFAGGGLVCMGFPAGSFIDGYFTHIHLATGQVMAYQRGRV